MNKTRILPAGALLLAVACLMAGEAYWVQAAALTDGMAGSWEHSFMRRLLLLDLAAAFIVLSAPRLLVYAAFALQALASLFILSYVANLDLPPTLSAVVNGMGMAQETNESVWNYVSIKGLLLLLPLLGLKFYLWRRRPGGRFFRFFRLPLLGAGLLVLAGCYVHDHVNDRLDILQPNPPEVLENPILNHLRYRGFLCTWLQEYWYGVPFNYNQVYREVYCDSDAVMSLPVPAISPRISMIQVESLDWAALNRKINGLEVAPNLNAMARRSLLLRLDGVKHFVSANSEYEILNQKVAQAFFLYFEYLNRYHDSLALPFRNAGYDTAFIHGVTGKYMNRAYAYPRMGFAGSFFFEQIKERGYDVTAGLFDYNIADYDLLKFAADYAQNKNFYLHFIITVTMHGSVEAKAPAYQNWDGYWRSVNYFDEGLGHYLNSLPEGSTVILYGDHQSYHGPDKNDLVPFLIYIKGRDLSRLKVPANQVYTRCELSHYLRRVFTAHLEQSTGPLPD
jgi:hypothetical protein